MAKALKAPRIPPSTILIILKTGLLLVIAVPTSPISQLPSFTIPKRKRKQIAIMIHVPNGGAIALFSAVDHPNDFSSVP